MNTNLNLRWFIWLSILGVSSGYSILRLAKSPVEHPSSEIKYQLKHKYQLDLHRLTTDALNYPVASRSFRLDNDNSLN